MADVMVQEGIYAGQGESPPGFFTLMVLRTRYRRDAPAVRDLLARLWALYGELKVGTVRVRDWPPVTVPHGDLDVLLGYGLDAFDLDGCTVRAPLAMRRFRFQEPRGREAIAREAPIACGIQYADDIDTNLSRGELVVQFTAQTQLAVERAVVETWKLFDGEPLDGAGRSMAALEIAGVFSGSKRDDGRSWIDFHDGISNLMTEERENVVVIGANGRGPADWTPGGTYLAFMRLRIHLEQWEYLSREEQERIVGRDKRNGCPLRFENGFAVTPDECVEEWIGLDGTIDRTHDALRNVGRSDGDLVASLSHVHRANNLPDQPAADDTSFRIYRQGYQYFEAHNREPRFRVGINFVSFQNTPERLIRPLRSQSWMGGANFGGTDFIENRNGFDAQPVPLLTAYATGMFYVPPARDDERFPGAWILADPESARPDETAGFDAATPDEPELVPGVGY